MANKPARVIIDTNLWISFLLTKSNSPLDSLLRSGKIKLLFSQELLNEFLEVASRPKLKRYFKAEDLLELLTAIESHADFITVKSKVTVCRDPKDNFLLSLAKDARADYLITGDKDLLVLKRFEKTRIVTIASFRL